MIRHYHPPWFRRHSDPLDAAAGSTAIHSRIPRRSTPSRAHRARPARRSRRRSRTDARTRPPQQIEDRRIERERWAVSQIIALARRVDCDARARRALRSTRSLNRRAHLRRRSRATRACAHPMLSAPAPPTTRTGGADLMPDSLHRRPSTSCSSAPTPATEVFALAINSAPTRSPVRLPVLRWTTARWLRDGADPTRIRTTPIAPARRRACSSVIDRSFVDVRGRADREPARARRPSCATCVPDAADYDAVIVRSHRHVALDTAEPARASFAVDSSREFLDALEIVEAIVARAVRADPSGCAR